MRHPFFKNLALRFLILTLPVVLFIQACETQANEPKATIAAAAPNPAVPADGYIVQPTAFSEAIEITGTLVANQEVTIASELTRKVVHVQVKEGNFVTAGTLLFQLDDADLQAQLERLRQQEKLAALNEARFKDLIAHDAAIQQDYDQAITNLNVLKAEIRALAVTIDKTRIRAPFNGRIGIVRVYPGALVSPNTVLTNIVDDTRIKVEFSVPEKYANLVTIGKTQQFTVQSDTAAYAATVVAKESRMNEQTRTLLVEAIGPNPKGRLVPGQSARLNLALHTSNDALKVPSQALMPSSQGYAVYVAKNNKVQLTPVTIGQRGAQEVQILNGLNQGDTVITSNLLRLVPGADVALVKVK
ncbi:efflux RND transporter periplasmic adaptor subunit [Paraflavitalea sp. CAU 1676]|uniref:efflux RND transporter periplasmic adaptor subunit n=1 Tax=Paraflavitalea sp. CAU 1676 TaxID=3032598 RepID=UPI0023DC1046|nr:efflux RND transporter periplasmic adaptor subunit [Paraflavitalea sp. CAU 1676]MDF2186934.1 efflux RND transporter periplasmic adaptor subunit [Paraflavitalea sp. CAU 1676]